MPCTKCEEGKYKWGKTGECEYATKEDCESANHKYNKMKPTPLGKKSYEEYAKELKEFNLSKVERVDLGLVEDATKLSDIQLNRLSLIKKNGEAMLKLADLIDKQGSDAISAFKKGENLLGRIEEAAKNLGIKPNTIGGYKELVRAEVDFLTYRKRYNF